MKITFLHDELDEEILMRYLESFEVYLF